VAATVPPRSVLVERKASYARPAVFAGDEVYICLPTISADADVTCSVEPPNGERVQLDVRRRSSDLFADHVAVMTVDLPGRYLYTFRVDDRRAGGAFTVKPASRKSGKGRRR